MEEFRIDVPESMIDDLHRRLDATRWPDELPAAGDTYGVPLQRMRQLADHWRHGYDWRAAEAALNSHPQLLAEIDGQPVHVLHLRSTNPAAVPLLLTHGWPGSIVEFQAVIDLLGDDFHLVIPSIPGWGFSTPVRQRGWDVDRVARAFAILMRRLGYQRYGVHGGDWGAAVSRSLSAIDADRVAAVHLSYLPTPPPPGVDLQLSADDQQRIDRTQAYLAAQPGIRVINGTRPQTPTYAVNDSPVGLLAWLLDPMITWAGSDFAISDDQVITNVMLHWIAGSRGAAIPRLHRESGRSNPHTTQPVGVLVMPEDIVRPVRALAERILPVARWSEASRGGHFPGLEAPDILAADLRAFFLSDAVRPRFTR